MMSCGRFARFSAHTVSITPVVASAFSTLRPTLGQYSTRTGHAFSGGSSTTSQR
jgi:hypothetical protein